MSDPIYLRDIGFYLFVLPFLELVQNRLVVLTFGGTLLLGLAYFRMGSLRLGATRHVATDPKALRHVIANTVLLLTAWAWGLYLDRIAPNGRYVSEEAIFPPLSNDGINVNMVLVFTHATHARPADQYLAHKPT